VGILLIRYLPTQRCRRDLLEGDLMHCLEEREDALSVGRIDLVRYYERRLAATDFMLRGVA
jgi:hypothetical protein